MFWFVKCQFEFDRPQTAAVDLLRTTLSQEKWKDLVSQFSGNRVKIHNTSTTFQNSWNPIFEGEFSSTPEGSRLVGFFRVHWLVFIFVLGMLALLLFQIYYTWSQPEQLPGYIEGWKTRKLNGSLQFLGIFLLMNLVGWLIGLPFQRRILRVIKEASNDSQLT